MDLGQVHLCWLHPRVVAPCSQAVELPGLCLPPQGKLPDPHIAVASTPAIVPGGLQALVLGRLLVMMPMCPSLDKGMHVPWHHSSMQRHMTSWGLHWPTTSAYRPCFPKSGKAGLVGMHATQPLSQRPTHIQWLSLALSRWVPYLIGPFLHSPRPLPGRGKPTVLVWLHTLRTTWLPGRSQAIPIWPWWMCPIAPHL